MELDIIYNQDCLEGLKYLPDHCIDLVVTSPPYDDLREYNRSSIWNFEIFSNIAKELFRVIKTGGCVVWIVNDMVVKGSETGTSFQQALFFKECGFNLHDTMIWEKDSLTFPDKTRYGACFEYMFVFSKGKPKTINLIADRQNKYVGAVIHGTSRESNGKTYRKSNDKKSVVKEFGIRFNVWHQTSEKQNKTGHPAVFPEKLIRDHIVTWCNPNDIVLDPFLGSGTTAIAAIHTNRHYIGFEVDAEYFDIACNRLDEAERTKNHNRVADYSNRKE